MATRVGWMVLAAALLGPVASAAPILDAAFLADSPGVVLTGAAWSAGEESAAWGDPLAVEAEGGSLVIPLDHEALGEAAALRLTLEATQISGDSGRWAFLVRGGVPYAEQPLWIGEDRSTTRVLWRLADGPPPEAVGLRFDGAATVVLGRLRVTVPTDLPPLSTAARVIANGGFELGLAGWTPFGTVAPVVRLSDENPGSGRWCAEVTNRAALLPIVFTSWPLPQIGLPEDVGLITEHVFALEPGQPYTVSMLLRADQPNACVELGLYQDTGSEARARLTVTEEWRPYAIHVHADGRQGALWIRPARDGAPEGFRLWIDEVSLSPGLLQTAPRTRGSAPDLAIAATRSHGVYEAGEAITIVLRSFGFAAGTGLPVSLEVRDGFERLLRSVDVELPGVPAGEVSERVLALPVEGQGFFTITARWTEAGVACRRDLRVARFAHYPWPDSPFGISRGWDSDGPWELARSAGACWVREWLGLWDASEPEPGRRSLLTPVSFAERYERLGYRTLACVPFPSAHWASAANEATWREDDVLPFVGSRAYLPDDPSAFASHVASLATGLGARVEAIELLQEPLVSGWALPPDRYGPADYADLCRLTCEALEEAGWAGAVVGGAGALPTERSGDVIEALAGAGLKDSLDVWNAHAYLFALPAEALEAPTRRLRAAIGPTTPLWVTEFGVWGDDTPSPMASHRDFATLSELESADALVRAASILLVEGAERIFFAARSLPSHGAGNGRDWLVTPTEQPRKALPALAALGQLVGPRPVAYGSQRVPSGMARIFETHEGAVAIISPDYGTESMPELGVLGAEVIDLFGNALDAPPEGDACFYLRARDERPEALAQALGTLSLTAG